MVADARLSGTWPMLSLATFVAVLGQPVHAAAFDFVGSTFFVRAGTVSDPGKTLKPGDRMLLISLRGKLTSSEVGKGRSGKHGELAHLSTKEGPVKRDTNLGIRNLPESAILVSGTSSGVPKPTFDSLLKGLPPEHSDCLGGAPFLWGQSIATVDSKHTVTEIHVGKPLYEEKKNSIKSVEVCEFTFYNDSLVDVQHTKRESQDSGAGATTFQQITRENWQVAAARHLAYASLDDGKSWHVIDVTERKGGLHYSIRLLGGQTVAEGAVPPNKK